MASGEAVTLPAAALQPGWACNIWHEPVRLTPEDHVLLQRLSRPAGKSARELDGKLPERLRRFSLLV